MTAVQPSADFRTTELCPVLIGTMYLHFSGDIGSRTRVLESSACGFSSSRNQSIPLFVPQCLILFGRKAKSSITVAFPGAHKLVHVFRVKVFSLGHYLFRGSNEHPILTITFQHVEMIGFEPTTI
jgi:hypothetical protein